MVARRSPSSDYARLGGVVTLVVVPAIVVPTLAKLLGQSVQAAFRWLESSEHLEKFLALTWCQVRYHPRRLFRRMRCPTPFHKSRLQFHRTNRPL